MLPGTGRYVRWRGAVAVRQHRRSAVLANELDALNQTRKEIEQGSKLKP